MTPSSATRSFPSVTVAGCLLAAFCVQASQAAAGRLASPAPPLPKVVVARGGHGFVTQQGKPFVPMGLTYFRPHTGWAPQLWKRFDAEATREDFARMKELGVTCVRVFLSFGSFYPEPGKLAPEGLAKLDQFLSMAEQAGIYVHPTGPDHWEGTPEWARGDRIADEKVLSALETFWRLLAARYRGRNVLFAYDLLNEPEVRWDTPPMREKWNRYLAAKYGGAAPALTAWGQTNPALPTGEAPVPPPKDAPGDKEVLDYQLFRESVADEWTRRQAAAIKSTDPTALVTVGLIQWSVPVLTAGVQHYAAFRPERQAPYLDFLEVHFYPLEGGFYEYRSEESEGRNLAYLECVAREVARFKKPVVVAEFGWYGGGQLKLNGGKHPPASEEQQAQWCRRLVETTEGLAVGWLNWGFYDHPEARDVSELTGLLTVDGRVKAWGRQFQGLSARYRRGAPKAAPLTARPVLDWDLCVTSPRAAGQFRESYYRAFEAARKK